jgi:putative hemolysin
MIGSLTGSDELEAEDLLLLRGVFTLDERRAENVLTPRSRLAVADADATTAEAAHVAVTSGHARLPALGHGGRLAGVVLARDLMQALLEGRGDGPLRPLLREMRVAPPTQPLDVLLERLRRSRASIAAVVDEYGQLDGVVTVEDILEEVVGEIEDESDRPARVRRLPGGALLCAGDTSLGDLERLGVALPRGDAESVGGRISEELERLPRAGERLRIGDVRLRVLSMEGNRIGRVLVLPPGVAAEPLEAAASSS